MQTCFVRVDNWDCATSSLEVWSLQVNDKKTLFLILDLAKTVNKNTKIGVKTLKIILEKYSYTNTIFHKKRNKKDWIKKAENMEIIK